MSSVATVPASSVAPTATAPNSSARQGPPPQGKVPTGASASQRVRQLLGASTETWLALGVVIIVALLVVPLPPLLLDGLLALSLALSIVVLVVTLSTGDPLEFSAFPSLLLLLTLLRLGLNVSSTRLILSEGYAGDVIDAFGSFLIGGQVVVGLVIFLILVVINFMVITKGAGRIAEVAARFTLDAMPGKQMAIDADLGAGLIDEAEARRRRTEIARYSDFYGAMDGAAKFVRGDAVAGLIITVINLVGGFAIGMLQRGLSASESAATFSRLTVGDGLISQIPALIVSTAAGIIVTYGASSSTSGLQLGAQLTSKPRALWLAAAVVAGLGLMPGLPLGPFLFLGAGIGVIAWRRNVAVSRAGMQAATTQGTAVAQPEIGELLTVEPLEIEMGYALVPLADESAQGDLLRRIALMRRQVAIELGIVVPPARIRDNIQLAPTEYAIRIRGVKVAGGEVMPRYLLALDSTGSALPIEGIRTKDPTYSMPAVWVTPDRREEAELAGYNVVEAATVLVTHLLETIRRNAADLLSRQDARELVEGLRATHPALVEDLIPGKLALGTFHRVLQRLLREGVPVRDLVTILETLSDNADATRDPEVLTEQVRRALSTVIANLVADPDGMVRGITIGPRLEAALMQLFVPSAKSEEGSQALGPDQLTALLRNLTDLVSRARREQRGRILITPPGLRVGVRRLVEPILPDLPVISLGELPPTMPVEGTALWELPRA
jgi:flagellar biosynthesis protein FlhA